MRWKNFEETTTGEGHKVFFSGKDKHQHGTRFLVNQDIVNNVTQRMLPSLQQAHHHCLMAAPLNITVVQVHSQMSDYDNKTEEFCDQLQNTIDQTPKKDIHVVRGGWNAQVDKDARENWQGHCAPFCNDTNKRGLRLLEFATFNDLVLANTFGHHNAFRRWSCIAQMDNTTTKMITF